MINLDKEFFSAEEFQFYGKAVVDGIKTGLEKYETEELEVLRDDIIDELNKRNPKIVYCVETREYDTEELCEQKLEKVFSDKEDAEDYANRIIHDYADWQFRYSSNCFIDDIEKFSNCYICRCFDEHYEIREWCMVYIIKMEVE